MSETVWPAWRPRKSFTKKQRAVILSQTDSRCGYCGVLIDLSEMQIDHKTPMYWGGTEEASNLIASCRSCNNYKSTHTVEQFRKLIASTIDKLRRNSTQYRIASRFGVIAETDREVEFYFEQITTTTPKEPQ